MRSLTIYFCLSFLILLFACKKDLKNLSTAIDKEAYKTPQIVYPTDNLPNAERIALGRYLFYNNTLSLDSSISCASCHEQKYAFANNTAFSKGVQNQLGIRNSPSLSNIAFHPSMFREGSVANLEMQVLVPIQEHLEFNFNIVDIANRLEKDSYFVKQSNIAYPNKPSFFTITRAIAAFERTMISNQSKFDEYLIGNAELTEQELKGMQLFFGPKANCSHCHNGFNFTNYQFENNGFITDDTELGLTKITKKQSDLGKFKVASLRNVAITAPYMYNGGLTDLNSVIAYYNKGGNKHPNTHKILKPLGLEKMEKEALIAFLETLTDYQFINNNNLSKP